MERDLQEVLAKVPSLSTRELYEVLAAVVEIGRACGAELQARLDASEAPPEP
jgi:hypothetical protein